METTCWAPLVPLVWTYHFTERQVLDLLFPKQFYILSFVFFFYIIARNNFQKVVPHRFSEGRWHHQLSLWNFSKCSECWYYRTPLEGCFWFNELSFSFQINMAKFSRKPKKFQCFLNSFMMEIRNIYKPVHWFAELVSIW